MRVNIHTETPLSAYRPPKGAKLGYAMLIIFVLLIFGVLPVLFVIYGEGNILKLVLIAAGLMLFPWVLFLLLFLEWKDREKCYAEIQGNCVISVEYLFN